MVFTVQGIYDCNFYDFSATKTQNDVIIFVRNTTSSVGKLCQQPKNTFNSMFYWIKSCKKLVFTKNFLTQRGNKSRKSCLICHRAVYWSQGLGFPRSSQDSDSLPSRNFRDKKGGKMVLPAQEMAQSAMQPATVKYA